MKKKLVALIIISLFALTAVFSISPAKAAQGNWITEYTVRDLSTGEILMQKSASGTTSSGDLLESTQLNVTVTITVSMTVPNSELSLTTSMQHSTQDRYWELKTTGYAMEGYNPNSQTVTFSQNEGTLIISCYGKIPTGLTTSSSGGQTLLHKPFDFALIQLKGPSGEILDELKPKVIDPKISEYQQLHDQSTNALQELIAQGVAQAYVSLYTNVINGSKDAADAGFVDNAISQLHQLSITEAPPVTEGSSMADTLFLPVAGALAAIAVIGIILFARARGKASYMSQVVEDQIRDLEGLTLRAAKVDKTLSAGLETIEDRLKRATGA